MHCPQCLAPAHPVCGNPECVCQKRIPEGEASLIWRHYLYADGRYVNGPVFDEIVGVHIEPVQVELSHEVFHAVWEAARANKLDPNDFMIQVEQCPWCGFEAMVDVWAEAEIQQLFDANGVNSFGELAEKREKLREID